MTFLDDPLRRALTVPALVAVLATAALPAEASVAEHRLRYGDAIGVSVVGRPELSVPSQPIRPDGHVSLPLVAEVAVAGKTIPEVTKELGRAYLPFLQAPSIVVTLTRVRPLAITVLGQVGRPGRFDFDEEPEITDALAVAGGLTARAARDGIKVVEPGKAPKIYDFERLLTAGQPIPRIVEGSVVEVSEVWYPDPYRLIPIMASILASTVVISREWTYINSGN